jgi:DUF4097 and DUF4098 domain-containing protein YvlB
MKFAAILALVIVVFIAWSGSPASFASDGRNLSSVNGSVRAEPGQSYGRLSAVNGNVRVGRGVIADEASTVNGEIVVEDDAQLGEADTVNGSLDIGEGVTVSRSASTVNGSLEIGKRSRIGGDVSTVSGEIEIKGAEVAGTVETRNGDIELSDGARVVGGIHVKKIQGDWGWGTKQPNKIHICGTCIVDGDLKFDRPVELRVDEGARIGKVIGESVTRR